jgi:MFS transporter, ACS family, allantoate permease
MFLILGSITMVYGIILALFMPDSPSTYKVLNEEEKTIAIERIRESRPGNNSKTFEKRQLLEAVKDVRFYLFALGVCAANIANGG